MTIQELIVVGNGALEKHDTMLVRPKIVLRPYQEKLVEKILQSNKNYVIALPQRTGKSVIAFSVKELGYYKRTLIVVDKVSLFSEWKNLAKKHGVPLYLHEKGNRRLFNSSKNKYQINNIVRNWYLSSSCTLTTIQLFKNDVEKGIINANEFDLIIIDEIGDSITKSFCGFRTSDYYELFKDCKGRIIGLMPSTMPCPRRDSVSREFNAEILSTPNEEIRDYVPKIETKKFLIDDPFITKVSNLFEREISCLQNALFNKLRKKIRGLTRIGVFYLKDEQIKRFPDNIQKIYYRLKTITYCHRQLLYGNKKILKDTPYNKFPAFNEWINSPNTRITKLINIIRNRPNKKIVIFVPFIDTARFLFEELKNNDILSITFTGQIKERLTRENVLHEFKKGKTQCLICTENISGKGIDLSEASTVIHYIYRWDYYGQKQKTARIGNLERIGEEIYLIYKGTIEERKTEHLIKNIMRMEI